VESVDDGIYTLQVLERRYAVSEAGVEVSVYMAFPKSDKLEHVIQKATELGAYEIVAFPTARCISKPDEKSLSKKVDRWQKIAFSAAEQCGRGLVPKIVILPSYSDALMRAKEADKSILFYENESATTLHMALADCEYSSISLITGPEGGFEVHEVSQAKELGIQICTLGKRILRCETAPLCALSAVMYASGEF
jgi:16S rRNA (uracil1498-N3)-methyltransferase